MVSNLISPHILDKQIIEIYNQKWFVLNQNYFIKENGGVDIVTLPTCTDLG